jgi:RAB protein geranylgeranyltransferase component A
VHSQSAFLYTNYGTGDIAQGFCRIASVYGADYILHDKLKLSEIKRTEDQTFTFDSNLADEPIKIKEGVIVAH